MAKPYFVNPSNEDDLKILNLEYLSNHLLDATLIWNFSLDDQTLLYKSLKWRQPQMENDLKILKVEHLSNRLLDHTQIWNLSLDDQTIFCKSFKWWRPPILVNLKLLKRNISVTAHESYPNLKLKLRWPNHIV